MCSPGRAAKRKDSSLGVDTAFVQKRGRNGVNFLLDSKNQELIYDGQQLSGAMFKQPYKEQKWFECSE